MRQGLYTIPSGTGFLERLAEGLMAMAEGGDELALARMRVLLPTRRACRELQAAFLRLAGDKPLLLPRLQPIGDVDSDEIDLRYAGLVDAEINIPPAISTLERNFILATLVQKKDPSLHLDKALVLAGDLARLMDTVYTEDLNFSNLAHIVPQDLSDHWKITLEFLEIVTTAWPLILAERGQIDAADRRNRLLKTLAEIWAETPPDGYIIAAGSTGSIPSAGALLTTIANLPKGLVILPGLDKDLEKESWEHLSDTHPQATMRNLIKRMNKSRDDVKLWPEAEGHNATRMELLRAIMRPPETFGHVKPEHINLENLHIIEAANAREEAAAIAVALREIVEIPDKTACLVTPDRILARRVMTALKRWNIEVDDSAGGALATTQLATFMTAILRVIKDDFSPLSILDALKHGYQNALSENEINEFELKICRGRRPASGIEGLKKRAQIKDSCQYSVEKIENIFKPLMDLEKTITMDKACHALMEVAENLSGENKDFIWTRPESEAFTSFITSVIEYGEVIPPLDFYVFFSVYQELLAAEKYRPTHEPHRRILILGQLESRLVKRDVMILGGLNEGTWPRDVGHDPWMSRPMREKFGLPSAGRVVGLAAHDFVEHSANNHVIITRSLKAEGTATVPARWLQSFRTILKAEGKEDVNSSRYLNWARILDKSELSSPLLEKTPTPCPPLSERPKELSATSIEKWIKNPYRIYAERILKLKMLDPINKNTVAADRGNFVHEILQEFLRDYPNQIPLNARDIILDMAQQKRNDIEHIDSNWDYWQPRFERMIDWFLDIETEWRKSARPWLQEERAALEIDGFTVTAKADRIDRLLDGSGAVVIDYKTGSPPTKKNMMNGVASQLPIEAYLLAEGKYKNEALTPVELSHWKLSGRYNKSGEVRDFKGDMPKLLEGTEIGLKTLIDNYKNPESCYVAVPPSGARIYDDEKAYAHLARADEWSNGSESEDDNEIEAETSA